MQLLEERWQPLLVEIADAASQEKYQCRRQCRECLECLPVIHIHWLYLHCRVAQHDRPFRFCKSAPADIDRDVRDAGIPGQPGTQQVIRLLRVSRTQFHQGGSPRRFAYGPCRSSKNGSFSPCQVIFRLTGNLLEQHASASVIEKPALKCSWSGLKPHRYRSGKIKNIFFRSPVMFCKRLNRSHSCVEWLP